MAATLYTRKQLLEHLKRYHAETGRIPSMRDVDRDPSMPSAFTYKYRFGTFSDAIRLAFGKRVALRAPATRASDEKLAEDLRALAQRLGRAPSVSEMNSVKSAYHANTYIRHYGSWLNAVEAILGS